MTTSGAPLLVVENVRKTYTRGLIKRRQTFSLSADLEFSKPRIVGVIGPNGAGKTTLFEMITGSNTPSEGRIMVAGRNIQQVRPNERDRLAIHYHQSYQVRRFTTFKPPALMQSAGSDTPMIHLFDEPQFNTQDGYIGFMLEFFRKLRAEGRLVFMSVHPTTVYHFEILKEIAEEFLTVSGGRVSRNPDYASLIADPAVRAYLGGDMIAKAETLL
jgi:ABC-type branched-subunit amino acid transport system ATPase component